MDQDEPQCASCGTPLMGKFCHQCGEKALQPTDFSVRDFAADVVQQVTSLDFKLLRSFRALLLQPGRLTKEFALGRRRLYTPPLALFLMANVLYFFLAPHVSTFNASLANQLHEQFYSQWAMNSLVEKYRTAPHFALQIYDAKYNLVSKEISKSLVIINAPLLALLFFAINARRSRFFIVELVFSLHFFAFLMTVLTAAGIFYLFKNPLAPLISQFFEPIFATVAFTYFVFSVRRAYQTGWPEALRKGVYLSVAYLVTIIFYRFVLFALTLQVA
jgi:Protein of unknown function (DUF3667)